MWGSYQLYHLHKPGQGCSGPVSGVAVGHLTATCPAKEKLYPFCQPVVSCAGAVQEWLDSNASSSDIMLLVLSRVQPLKL